MIPSGISQRTQWMQKYSGYCQQYLAAKEAYSEAAAPRSKSLDGMPHGNAKSDVVASTAERREKAYLRYRYAKDAMEVARAKRVTAMKPLNDAQKLVLTKIYFDGQSRRAVAQELNRSDFWVRAQERTGLFQLELPPAWETDILP